MKILIKLSNRTKHFFLLFEGSEYLLHLILNCILNNGVAICLNTLLCVFIMLSTPISKTRKSMKIQQIVLEYFIIRSSEVPTLQLSLFHLLHYQFIVLYIYSVFRKLSLSSCLLCCWSWRALTRESGRRWWSFWFTSTRESRIIIISNSLLKHSFCNTRL